MKQSIFVNLWPRQYADRVDEHYWAQGFETEIISEATVRPIWYRKSKRIYTGSKVQRKYEEMNGAIRL
jgi:hypothetical protein